MLFLRKENVSFDEAMLMEVAVKYPFQDQELVFYLPLTSARRHQTDILQCS
ncbi:hypothetical protein [Cytobacillus sp. IB215316]|uniref:hypothetical protein n=1 Tax=Cytobacillus sp. IB215316 TaxID=3097354 RepID=UPI002A0D34C1|nr:hypothetical protein [Cytobacillus sp. IB215316]MDX8359330.1 hypothetical protein [Cytobacillus sp. IB215316]